MLDDLKNHALDDHKNFWPVAHWRPEPEEEITPDLCLKVAAVQSAFAFAVIAIASAASGHVAFARFGSAFAMVAVMMFLTFYGLLRLGLARMWNHRARAMRSGE